MLLLACFSVSKIIADPVHLYDGNRQSLPDKQGWLYLLDPPVFNLSRQVLVERGFNLNTQRNPIDQAGYFARTPQSVHPHLPETFDRMRGYRIDFSLQLLAENHASPDHAGFSIIVISGDLKGIELGFGMDAIFAQSADRTRAESINELPFGFDSYVDFVLEIEGEQYILRANDSEILTGSLRDYSALGSPYDIANFLFFGDASTFASASANIRSIRIDTKLDETEAPIVEPEPTEPAPEVPDDALEAIFVLDESASHLRIHGSVLGGTLTPQSDGSLMTSFSGELQTLLSPSIIFFKSQSQIDANLSGVWMPKPGGEPGSAPADFGAQAIVLIANAVAAARNIAFSLSSLPLDFQTEGAFSVSGMRIQFPEESSAAIDFAVGGFAPTSLSLAGLSAENESTTLATLISKDNVQTLTLPVDAAFSFEIFSPGDATMIFTGNLVASRPIPLEPESSPVLSIALVNDEIHVEWEAMAGRKYTIESSSNLVDWVVLSERILAEDNLGKWTTTPQNHAQFYRILISN